MDLEKTLKEIKQRASKIEDIKKTGIRASTSLDKLFLDMRNIESEITQICRKDLKGIFKDSILNYCYLHFNNYFNNKSNENYFSIFTDIVPQVGRFVGNVKEYFGKKILAEYGNDGLRIGKISGKCKLSNGSSSIFVPVEHLYECFFKTLNPEWKIEESFQDLPILEGTFDPRICKDNPVSDEKGIRWVTYTPEYGSGDIISRTRKVTFFIGDNLVEEELKKKRAIKIEKSISLPPIDL